jgi:protein SCO1/2
MADQPLQKPPTTNTRLMMLGTLIVAVVGGAVVLYALVNRPSASPAPTPHHGAAIIEGEAFTGIEVINPPRALADFTLTDQEGQPFSLSDLNGKLALIQFGYTHCPDVCPSTLLKFKQIKTALGDQADQVAFVLISVDGERDTPEVMKDYISRFDPAFIGLTGRSDEVLAMGGDYNLYVNKQPAVDSAPDSYLVDHTATTFTVDQEGNLVALYIYGTDTSLIIEDIQGRLST